MEEFGIIVSQELSNFFSSPLSTSILFARVIMFLKVERSFEGVFDIGGKAGIHYEGRRSNALGGAAAVAAGGWFTSRRARVFVEAHSWGSGVGLGVGGRVEGVTRRLRSTKHS